MCVQNDYPLIKLVTLLYYFLIRFAENNGADSIIASIQKLHQLFLYRIYLPCVFKMIIR